MGTVDFGKIIALHNAGWSNAKIAEEMRITEEEYDNVLMGLLDATDSQIRKLEHRYEKIILLIKGWCNAQKMPHLPMPDMLKCMQM